MIRFVFRALSLFLLAIAIILAVIDISRSVAASAIVMTPLLESMQAALPRLTLGLRDSLQGIDASLWWLASAVLSVPGAVLFAIMALLSYMIGHKRRRERGFAAPV
ncbi:hypothetical protein B7H23_03485 [Notoacmeibacter marinus]|uniref:Uncharacterized protein n=1 Tax=Notoacmeibacter marinus TaxID=1876515 RepID=A0A231V1L2_9HYPH|nr:hypothetical protein [Notoacmeibacter marinus]OXT02007.1 hypothetical protein B7H23_03485 [Notoacmeibacter marinus]